MYFGGVDLPQELVNAHRDGSLVFFVGAGASFPSPSNLPSFKGLAEEIADTVGVGFDSSRGLDVFLGELDDLDDIDVHSLINQLIDRADSEPNTLHVALSSLAASSGAPKVVTTNYDRHLSTSLEEIGIRERYEAPAMPIGDDFSGIVYLHGSVDQPPRRLIATDRDFGAAYLRDAWATRFLERVFLASTVLFVGYSHEDVVMSYLAKGLRSGGRRFVLTHEPQREHWARLGITPIGYDGADDHQALSTCLAAWAEISASGLLAHRKQIKRIAAASPALSEDEDSYIRHALKEPAWIDFFLDSAEEPAWVEWVSGTEAFRELIAGTASNDVGWPLARWLANQWLASEQGTQIGWSSLRDLRALPPLLASALLQGLHDQDELRPWQELWVALIVSQVDSYAGHAWLLAEVARKARPDVAMAIFESAGTTRVVPRESWGLGVRGEIVFAGEEFLLRQLWESAVRPNLALLLEQAVGALEHLIRHATRLARQSGNATDEFDAWSYRRSAIEQHEQDAFPDAEDVLIDALRDCIDLAIDDRAELIPRFDSWIAPSTPQLLRRLSVYAHARRSDKDADAKARWLVANDLLFDVACHHEVFDALARIGPLLTSDGVESIVNVIASDKGESESDRYEVFLLTEWIARHTSNEVAERQWQELQAAHPEWAIREHPDFLGWHGAGFIEPVELVPPELLHEQISQSAASALEGLFALVSEDVLGAKSESSAAQTIRSTVELFPEDGLRLLDAKDNNRLIEAAVLAGWRTADLSPEMAEQVVVRLSSEPASTDPRSVAELLKSGREPGHGFAWHQLPSARDLAMRLWTESESTDQGFVLSGDPLTEAINDMGGFLAEFWTLAVQYEWRRAEEWSALPSALREPLEGLLTGRGRVAELARVFVVSQLHFWHAADREWTIEHVLPLLSWADPGRARTMWSAFLTWGRWSSQLLDDGLLELYLDAVDNWSMGDRSEDRLPLHLAHVALQSSADPEWITRFTKRADASSRTRWLEFVGRELEQLPTEECDRLWEAWLGPYWRARVAGRPRRLRPTEASALVRWAMPMGDHRCEALELAARPPFTLDGSALALDGFTAERVSDCPDRSAALFRRLLEGTTVPPYNQFRIREVFNLFSGMAGVDTADLREAALGAGCRDAADW